MNIYEMTGAALQLREMLKEEIINEQDFQANLDAIGAGDKVETYCQIERQLEADIEEEINVKIAILQTEIDRLEAVKKTKEANIERIKKALLDFIEACGGEKQKGKTFTAWIAETKSVRIDDVDKLPEEYKAVKYTPDKAKIKRMIEMGADVPGAEIETKMGVRIK